MTNELATTAEADGTERPPVESTIVFVFGPAFSFAVWLGVNHEWNFGDGDTSKSEPPRPLGVDAIAVPVSSTHHH